MTTLYVYPTSRKILSNLIDNDNVMLEKALTIDDFFKKSLFVPNKIQIGKESRIIFLKKVVAKINKDVGLGSEFRKNFLFFLKNSPFIFKFFDEIFAEKSSLEDIETHDLQGEFIDHIEVLQEIYNAYKKLLDENNFYDQSTIDAYEINTNFLLEYDKVEFILEGYLSKKEFDILQKCSQVLPFFIRLYSSSYNKKMFKYFNQDFIEQYSYLLDLSQNEIVEKVSIPEQTIFEVESFDNRISQCSFVAKKIYDFLYIDKFKAENIAVILPDETFAQTLQQMDTFNNLNFAMGISIKQSDIYKKLQSIYDHLLQEDAETRDRIKIFALEDIAKKLKREKSKNGIDVLFELLEEIENDDEDSKKVITQIMYFLQNLKSELNKLSFSEMLSYFLHLLKTKTTPHKNGGTIKVMGVLESRNIKYDGVVIVDFNDDIVPQLSQKDIFLNSDIRKYSSIPTKEDRENLQKYFYKRLFDNSKKVAISYVHNDEKTYSKFMSIFGIKTPEQNSNYNNLIFQNSKDISHKKEDVFEYTNEDRRISFNKIKTFIDCKRKFYNQYILKIKLENTISNEMSVGKLGAILHNILKDIKTKEDLETIEQKIKKTALIYKNNSDNHLYFEILKFQYRLDGFVKYMHSHFEHGYTILETEKNFSIVYKDFNIIGAIDKIETRDNNKEIHIVDYKTSKPKKLDPEQSLQLYIYYLATQQEFRDAKITAYNHHLPFNSKISISPEDIKDKFDEHLDKYTQPFTVDRTENTSICRYCDYATMCNRGA